MKYLGYLRDWLAGVVVTAIAFGLMALIVSATARPVAMRGDGAKVVAGLLACLPFFAWVHLAFRGWVGQPVFGRGSRLLFVLFLLILIIPPVNLIVPYWVGRAVVSWYREHAAQPATSTAPAAGEAPAASPLFTLFEAMVANGRQRLESGDYAGTVEETSKYIDGAREGVFKDKPHLLPAFGPHLARLYTLRARAHYALAGQSGDRAQLESALADVEQALGLPPGNGGEAERGALLELKESIRGSLAPAESAS